MKYPLACAAPALVVLLAAVTFSGCGRSSGDRDGRGGAGASAGGGAGADRGGAGGRAGSGGSSASSGSGGAGEPGDTGGGAGTGGANSSEGGAASGGTDAGFGGEPRGGTGGTTPAQGGAAGEDVGGAGESTGGAGGGCQDLCTEAQPACCIDELRCVERLGACRIDILAATVSVPYEYTDLEQAIAAVPGDIELSIELEEVERAAVESPPASRFQLVLGAEASAELSSHGNLFLHPFRMSCDEEELFVGLVYELGGAAALQTPVLHVIQGEDESLVLRLGAWQGAWLFGSDGREELRERLDRPELRGALCRRGILGELR